MHKGHLIESETYVGASVEALESGVFRNDIPYKFDLDPVIIQKIIDEIDSILLFAIEVEAGMNKEHVTNYKEVRDQIVSRLQVLRDTPKRKEHPNIYHLDVGAMYPNIILTNRLQPSAIVSDEICAACDFNRPESKWYRTFYFILIVQSTKDGMALERRFHSCQ